MSQSDEVAALQRRRVRRRRWMWVAVTLAAAMPLVRWSWWIAAERRLHVVLDRLEAAGVPSALEDLFPEPIPPERNGALVLRRAEALLVVTADQIELIKSLIESDCCPEADPPSDPKSWAQVESLVSENAEVLRLLRDSRRLDAADWGLPRTGPLASMAVPSVMGIRHMVRLLGVAALLRHRQGEDEEALELVQDIFDMARKVSAMPFFLPYFMSEGIRSLGVRYLEDILPDLTVAARPSALRLLEMLLDESELTAASLKTMHGEYLDSPALPFARGEVSVNHVAGVLTPPGVGERVVLYPWRPLFMLDVVRTLEMVEATLLALKQAPAARPARFAASESDDTLLFGPLKHMMPGMVTHENFLRNHHHSLANRRLAATAIALRLYELDQGVRPSTLEELVPAYLEAVPADPFDPREGAIRYTPDAPRALLYSVGFDEIDDLGTPRAAGPGRPAPTWDIVFWLDPDNELHAADE